MELLCKKSCWYEDIEENEDPFVIQGETYKVTKILGDRVEFINALGYSHKWYTSDPEFHEYLVLLESQLPETSTETPMPYVKPTEKFVMDDDSPYGLIAKEAGRTGGNWSDKHYDFKYKLTEEDIERGFLKLDPYFVSLQWGLGAKDPSGVLFHCVKTCARFKCKNTIEREIKALYNQVSRLAELHNIEV